MKITTSTTLTLGGKSALDGPAETKAHRDCFALYSGDIGPLHEAKGFSAAGKYSIASPVSILLNTSGPSAIIGRIALGIVDSVYGMLVRWAPSHVGKKSFKRIHPSLADINTTATVIFESSVVSICASSDYFAPCLVFSRPLTNGLSVDGSPLPELLPAKASTRKMFAAFETPRVNCSFRTAVASANPLNMFASVWVFAMPSKLNHGQPAEFFTGQVLEKLVGWKRVVKSFVSGIHNHSMSFVSAASGLQSHVARLFSHSLNRWSMEAFA